MGTDVLHREAQTSRVTNRFHYSPGHLLITTRGPTVSACRQKTTKAPPMGGAFVYWVEMGGIEPPSTATKRSLLRV